MRWYRRKVLTIFLYAPFGVALAGLPASLLFARVALAGLLVALAALLVALAGLLVDPAALYALAALFATAGLVAALFATAGLLISLYALYALAASRCLVSARRDRLRNEGPRHRWWMHLKFNLPAWWRAKAASIEDSGSKLESAHQRSLRLLRRASRMLPKSMRKATVETAMDMICDSTETPEEALALALRQAQSMFATAVQIYTGAPPASLANWRGLVLAAFGGLAAVVSLASGFIQVLSGNLDVGQAVAVVVLIFAGPAIGLIGYISTHRWRYP